MTGADGTASVGTIAGSGLYDETQVGVEIQTHGSAVRFSDCRSLPGTLRQKGTFEHEDATSVGKKTGEFGQTWAFIMLDMILVNHEPSIDE